MKQVKGRLQNKTKTGKFGQTNLNLGPNPKFPYFFPEALPYMKPKKAIWEIDPNPPTIPLFWIKSQIFLFFWF